jgi:hypothetical protein
MTEFLNYNNLNHIKDRAGFCGLKAVEWYANMVGASAGVSEREIVRWLLEDLAAAYGKEILEEVLSDETTP